MSGDCNCTCQIAGSHDPDCAIYGAPLEPPDAKYPATAARWNDAIDWLLNSRHTADPDIQRAFWGIVDGKHTRDQADKL